MKFPLRPLLFVLFGLLVAPLIQAADAGARVYELRIYTTNAGKFDDLLSRFRDHTMKIFERHGMRNIGCWTPVESSEGGGSVLYYILEHTSREVATASWAAFRADPEWVAVRTASEAGGPILAQPPESTFLKATDYSPLVATGGSFEHPRVFELRRYTAAEGKLPALHAFFRNSLLGLFAHHGMTGIGYWDPTDADKGAGTQLAYLLAHASREAAAQSWQAMRADAFYFSARAEAYKEGNLTAADGVRSILLNPVDFSPLK